MKTSATVHIKKPNAEAGTIVDAPEAAEAAGLVYVSDEEPESAELSGGDRSPTTDRMGRPFESPKSCPESASSPFRQPIPAVHCSGRRLQRMARHQAQRSLFDHALPGYRLLAFVSTGAGNVSLHAGTTMISRQKEAVELEPWPRRDLGRRG
jgi:hypothetical protein